MGLEIRKVVAKIALASIASKYGVAYALSPQFDRLRQIRTATTPVGLPLSIFCNKSFMSAQNRAVQQQRVI